MIFEEVASASEIDAEDWRRLVPHDGLFLTREWSAVFDADRLGECRYLVAHAEGRIRGIMPAHSVRHAVASHYSPALLAGDSTAAAGEYLILGARSGFHNVALVDPDLGRAGRAKVLTRLIEAALDSAGRRGAKGVVWPYLVGDPEVDEGALHHRLRWPPGPPVAAFDVGGSWEYHLSGMPSRRRLRFAREQQTFRDAGLAVRTVDRVDPEWLAPLVCRLESKYGRRVTPAGVSNLMHRIQNSGLEIVCFMCMDAAHRPLGATMALRLGNNLWPRFIGLDGAFTGTSLAHFTLAYYAPMRWLAEQAGGTVYLGPEATETKRLRGARFVETKHLVAAVGD